jgi:hypothetical protein
VFAFILHPSSFIPHPSEVAFLLGWSPDRSVPGFPPLP